MLWIGNTPNKRTQLTNFGDERFFGPFVQFYDWSFVFRFCWMGTTINRFHFHHKTMEHFIVFMLSTDLLYDCNTFDGVQQEAFAKNEWMWIIFNSFNIVHIAFDLVCLCQWNLLHFMAGMKKVSFFIAFIKWFFFLKDTFQIDRISSGFIFVHTQSSHQTNCAHYVNASHFPTVLSVETSLPNIRNCLCLTRT